MNINQLNYFIAIVKTQSFSTAAYDLFLSQSSISKQIKALEEELGCSLFKREHSKIFLSEAGMKFLEYAQPALEEYQNMLLTLESYQAVKQVTVRLGSIPIVSSYGVANQIATFTTVHREKNIYFDLHENNQFSVIKELLDDIIDIALVRLESLTSLKDYDVIPYVIDNIVLVCHKANPLANKSVVTPEELSGYPMLLLDTHSALHKIVINDFAKRNLELKIQCVSSRHRVLLEILSTNSAIAMLPSRLVDFQLYPNLVTVPLADSLQSCVALIKLKHKKLNKITKEFWNYWQKECSTAFEK
ncbi:MAG: LysR family transcriptional regulator [Acidaminococcaceae bacterium]